MRSPSIVPWHASREARDLLRPTYRSLGRPASGRSRITEDHVEPAGVAIVAGRVEGSGEIRIGPVPAYHDGDVAHGCANRCAATTTALAPATKTCPHCDGAATCVAALPRLELRQIGWIVGGHRHRRSHRPTKPLKRVNAARDLGCASRGNAAVGEAAVAEIVFRRVPGPRRGASAAPQSCRSNGSRGTCRAAAVAHRTSTTRRADAPVLVEPERQHSGMVLLPEEASLGHPVH